MKLLFIILLINAYFAYSYVELSIPTRVNNPSKKFLKADLYSSDTNIAKPVVLIQTPYNKAIYRVSDIFKNKQFYDSLNYNYVFVDWRGFYANKQYDSTAYNRGFDGYDIIEWIAKQKWSNGKIGTWGGSALGHIQFLTASENPPHLICSAPFIKDFKTKYEDFYYGGVFKKEHNESTEKLGLSNTELILSHPTKDVYWQFIENQNKTAEKIKVPMFLCTGWFDHFPSDVIRAYEDLRKKSDISVRDNHKLLIGPWLHDAIGELEQGELEFPEAVNYAEIKGKQFLDFYLLGLNNGWDKNENVIYYEIGSGWKSDNSWNNIKRQNDTLYFNESFKLTSIPPYPKMSPIDYFPDTIFYNPRNPSPTFGGSRFNPFNKNIKVGPIDISNLVENRNDVIVYSSDILNSEYTINGKSKIELYFSSNREDTDFSIRLCDVYPDGKSYILTQGIKRARFRNSFSSEKLLAPDKIDSISIDLNDLSYVFLKGHKIRVIVSSSNYPMFDLNLNNGKEMYAKGDTLIANNLIFRTNMNSSKIIFQKPLKISDLNENIKTDELFISPNPVNNQLFINTKEIFNNYNIYNVNGELIQSDIFNDNILLNNVSNGIYFIKLSNNSKTIFKKFVLIK